MWLEAGKHRPQHHVSPITPVIQETTLGKIAGMANIETEMSHYNA
jgi:hypothetical protein